MPTFTTFASYIVRELLHTKLLLFACLLFGGTLIIGSLFAELMIGNPLKVMLDFMLLSYQLFTLGFIPIFVIPYFNKSTRISQFAPWLVPVANARAHLLGGALLAFTATLTLTGLGYFLLGLPFIFYKTGFWTTHLALAFFAIFVESFYLTCAALLLSLMVPQAIAYCALFTLYIIGYAQPTLVTFLHKQGFTWASFMAHYLVPDLSFLDIKNQVLYQLPFDKAPFVFAVLYTIALGLQFFCVAMIVFKKKRI